MRVADQDMSHNNDRMSCNDHPEYCNNGKPKSSNELQKMRNQRNKNESNFFSEVAYAADNVGAIASDMEMITVDTIGAVVIAGGCSTGVGCLPAMGYALAIDIGVSMFSPLGLIENGAGYVSMGATTVSDFLNGSSYVHMSSDGSVDIGLGRDTVVSGVMGALGQIPEANFDAVVSSAQLEYDDRRRSGDLGTVSIFQLHIPAAPDLWGNGNGWPNGIP
jgi:hypothetical protein